MVINEAKVNVRLLCRAVLPLYLALLFDRPVSVPGQLQWALSERARRFDPVIIGFGGFSSAQIVNIRLHVPFFFLCRWNRCEWPIP